LEPAQLKTLKVYRQTTLNRGPMLGSQLVIRDEAAWKKLVGIAPELSKLAVDFSKQMVLAYAEKPRGRGKHLSGASVRDVGDRIQVDLDFIKDPPHLPQLQDIIWPNHFIVVDRSSKPVRFAARDHPFDWDFIPVVSASATTNSNGIVAPNSQPKLTIKVDGTDVVVSTTITANNSPHVLQTSYRVDGKLKIHLKYVLIQNTDLLAGSLKPVTVTWRIKGLAAIPVPYQPTYHIEKTELLFSTAELADLLPQLQGLKTAGEKKVGLPVHALAQ
jgi:hypothetical protein